MKAPEYDVVYKPTARELNFMGAEGWIVVSVQWADAPGEMLSALVMRERR